MLDRKSTFIQNLRNSNGQVALFVALIFQILFLFFAMVINVGLLVHHKINLQNSVDLAAYYGAMKQAENMNAIAHMNYQIRQSWKLLAWRYRMIGSAGEWTKHPYDKSARRLSQNVDEDTVFTNDAILKNFQEAPAFCITYVPFKPMPHNENTCRNMADQSGIRLFEAPPVIASHQAFSQQLHTTAEILRNNALKQCVYMGSINYKTLAQFVVAYNIDQGNRMDMIAALSRATSLSTEDFYDIDGQSARTGIEKTLSNNLTSANRGGLGTVKVFNSLGSEACNATGVAEGQPAKWLNPIRIYPGFSYIDTKCAVNGSDSLTPVGTELTGARNNFPYHIRQPGQFLVPERLVQDITSLSEYVGYRQNLNDNYNFSIGVEKNPWCMAYTGVSAESTPKVPFSPFGAVRLKARAFYKPFGGRIGPWYMSKWGPGSNFSNTGKRTDPLLPPRVTDLSLLESVNDPDNKKTRAANFSRFVGDQYGLQSYRMLGYYGKAIYELDPRWRSNNIVADGRLYDGDDSPHIGHWDHLPFDVVERSGDILAWNPKTDAPSTMRRLELAAIAPDAFDIAYYSIEPDYYNVYYKRIRDGYLRGPGSNFNKSFRPDIGYHKDYRNGSENYEEFSVRKQMLVLEDQDLNLPVKEKFTFTVMDWKNLLTGWIPKGLSDYSLNPDRFGKCSSPAEGSDNFAPSPPTSGNCVVGGSTGYSVKMVSSDYLKAQTLILGGEAAGAGPLKNPPPPDEEF